MVWRQVGGEGWAQSGMVLHAYPLHCRACRQTAIPSDRTFGALASALPAFEQ